MSEIALWLLFCVSGVMAFAAIHFQGWHPAIAILSGLLLTGAGWTILYFLTTEKDRPEWVRLDLSLNLSFGLLFVAAGAVAAHYAGRNRGS